MKRIWIIIFFSFLLSGIRAQTVADAKRYIYYDRLESAKQVLQSIIKNEASSPDAWYWLGEIYLKQNKIDSAGFILQEGTRYFSGKNFSSDKYPLLAVGRAHVLLDEGKTAAAKKEMGLVIASAKKRDFLSLWAVARAHIDSKNGDVNRAVELLKKAIIKNNSNAELYLSLGDAYRKLTDGSNAVINYDKALERDPALAAAMYNKGRIYKSQHNTEIFLDRMTRACEIDSAYAPALYELYYFYFYRDIKKAGKFLAAWLRNTDPTLQQAYMVTDFQYVTKKYEEAIDGALRIIHTEGDRAQPRLYKLIAYSYASLGDSSSSLEYMNAYFGKQKPANLVAKDFELEAVLLEKINPDKTAAVEWYKKALAHTREEKDKLDYMMTLADLQKEAGNREREAVWREQIYKMKDRPGNLDLYNWGVALYYTEKYRKADSVFSLYEEKYPDQVYGYLWRAKCNAIMDSTMEMGLAVPHYKKLIEIARTDTVKYKSILLKAYGYLGTYLANITRDYKASLDDFEAMLRLDPDNNEAREYTELLRKWIESDGGTQ